MTANCPSTSSIVSRTALLCFAVLAFGQPPVRAQAADAGPLDLFPPIEPFETGYLKVSDVHEIYYELCGRRDGKPVMVLHGGPGGGCYPELRRYHDPEKYLIVLHDQRGAGRSRPHCELRENTTQNLVEDIERLRRHLKLGRVQVFGGSWGSTLGLAYAETYPDNVSALVLRGVFTATRQEIDHFYHGGVGLFFPEVYARLQSILPRPEQHDYPAQLLKLLRDDDPDVRRKTARAWAAYELRAAFLEISDEQVAQSLEEWDPYDFALIENYYMANACFLEEGQLLRDASKLSDVSVHIVQGRYDAVCPPVNAYRLHHALPDSRLKIMEASGHAGREPGTRAALLEITNSLGR
jgi:proline iminopeptidase